MVYGEWEYGPFGLDNQRRGQTLRCERTVLFVVYTVTAGMRLGDVAPLLEADLRVQVVFTFAPSALISGGVRKFLARLGGVTLPWRQAVQTRFDLTLAASDGLLEWVHAPVVTMLHGAGYNKYPARRDGYEPQARRQVAGPEPARLVCHGRMISSALVLPTRLQVERLRQSCPEAVGIAVVAGDPPGPPLTGSSHQGSLRRPGHRRPARKRLSCPPGTESSARPQPHHRTGPPPLPKHRNPTRPAADPACAQSATSQALAPT